MKETDMHFVRETLLRHVRDTADLTKALATVDGYIYMEKLVNELIEAPEVLKAPIMEAPLEVLIEEPKKKKKKKGKK